MRMIRLVVILYLLAFACLRHFRQPHPMAAKPSSVQQAALAGSGTARASISACDNTRL
jgi:hypothetical protein